MFAGTRFLKRGVDEDGNVANFVETEQIVQDICEGNVFTGHVSAYVQIRYVITTTTIIATTIIITRGSIPLHWYQDQSLTSPKPMVYMTRTDPTYESTAVCRCLKFILKC